MKISKLFHWLYAILLLLPIAIFLPNGLYYAFNEHATAQEKTKQEPIYYDSNEVNSFSDIHVNSIYQYTDNFIIDSSTQNKTFGIIKYLDDYVYLNSQFNSSQDLILYSGNNNLAVRQSIEGGYISVPINDITFPIVFVVVYNELNLIYTHFSYYNGNYVKEYQEVTYSMSIVDSMQNAWQDTWQLPIFNWSYDSFLNVPLQYLGDLFGIPQNSSILAPMSYWLAISVIWLVFDLIMYVPLLAHRWIDKARLE